jgi:hypothetical protein
MGIRSYRASIYFAEGFWYEGGLVALVRLNARQHMRSCRIQGWHMSTRADG